MSTILKNLYTENNNPFKLSLCAGQNSIRNTVTWVYMVEDEYLIPYFYGTELAVTTGVKMAQDSSWLMTLVQKLSERHLSGLIVNIGKYVTEIPQDVLDFCNTHDFPLFIMPWEIKITELIQTFCMSIMKERHDSMLHDNAMQDAILRRGNLEESKELLSKYYDLNGTFTVILIRCKLSGEEMRQFYNIEYLFLNRIRRFKTQHDLKGSRFGIIRQEQYELIILNNTDFQFFPEIRNLIFELYEDALKAHALFIGAGIEVQGISQIHKSFLRAQAAIRMAMYQDKPFIRYKEMGFYKILFSLKNPEVLYSYADEILSPLDVQEMKTQGYLDLLKAYIKNDRSLEKTAAAMYLHRNTVNYRIQKMKTLLNCPLKTAEDLFPYQVALMIRDIQAHDEAEATEHAAHSTHATEVPEARLPKSK